MSLRIVLEELIERNKKNIEVYERKIKVLPKGSLHQKHRGNKTYYYLKYRDSNGKRIDKYVRKEAVPTVQQQLKKRKEYLDIVAQLKEDIKIARKGLGY